MKSELLANVIWLLHLLFVLWVVIVPFTNSSYMLVLHLILMPFIWCHWLLNSDVCALTLAERYFRGVDSTESFFHNLVSPVYTLSDSSVGRLAWIVSIALWTLTLTKVLRRPAMIKDAFYPPRET